MLAIALIEAGDLERANAVFEASMIEGVDSLPDDTLLFVTVGLIVEAGILLQRVDRIDDLARWLETIGTYPQVFTGVMYLGATARLLGGLAHLRGDNAEAETHFRAAIESQAAIGAKPMLAATRLDWADMLLDSGDREGAAELARRRAPRHRRPAARAAKAPSQPRPRALRTRLTPTATTKTASPSRKSHRADAHDNPTVADTRQLLDQRLVRDRCIK